MDFPAVISDISTRLQAVTARIAELAEQRRPHAFDAVTGDASARRAIEKIDVDAAAARNESETLTVALEEAQRRQADHLAKLAAEDRARRANETRAACAECLEIDVKFDEAARQLVQLLRQREECISKMAQLGVIYSGVINALRRRSKITAAHAAGLNRFAELDLRGSLPGSRGRLAELDGVLRAPVMQAADADQESA
jgi:hypothetical protein